MQKFAFISRHAPTQDQIVMAKNQGIDLIPIGDTDAFTVDSDFVDNHGAFDGVVVVHPAAALRLASQFLVGIFQNGSRPDENQKPQFFAKSFHVYDLRD